MQTDVKAGHLNNSGVIAAFRTRIKGFICTPSTTLNTEVVIYDNASAASGTVLCRFDSGIGTATANATWSALIPGEGILAQNGVYVDLGTNGVTLTVFYG